ncbi:MULTISPECIES: hypothetical protein [Pseudomonas]|jgi:hypothetical protein|uniref:hypothetical protein n=1 Tax=Pseudomonas TaxID=286 RepID=UPI002360959A|nr:hypothetical protein [Pseudomonas sp. TNT2022 ID642]MDD1005315.1 hypothetical protein [Pseudomonas sp. TNT2022 ID642]
MSKLLAAAVLLILAGCTTNSRTHVVHGTATVKIDCSGLGSNWERCYKRAVRECSGRGYKVLVKSSEAEENAEDYPFGWNPAGYLTRTMVVVCQS